jgi:hypothetical protein
MADAQSIRDALCALEELSEPDLLQVATELNRWYSDELRDLCINLAHILAMATEGISL